MKRTTDTKITYIETEIPPGMTCSQYRRTRSQPRRARLLVRIRTALR
jgi:hypothetical protein